MEDPKFLELIPDLKYKTQSLGEKLAALEASTNEKQSQFSQSLSRVHDRVDEIDDRMDKAEHKMEIHTTTITNKISIIDSLTVSHKEAIGALNDTVSALKEMTVELRRDSKSFGDDIKDLKEAIKEISSTFKKVMWVGIGAAGVITLLSNGTLQKAAFVALGGSPSAQISTHGK